MDDPISAHIACCRPDPPTLGGAIGSEKLTKGSAKLTKPFLYFSMSFLPSIIYMRGSV
jgi:hypothetical protein